MKSSLHFIYDGVQSSDMGVMNVHDSSGLFSEQFVANITNQTESNLYGIPISSTSDKKPIEFTLTLYVPEVENLRNVVRWLMGSKKKFAPLVFNEFPERILFAKVVNFDNIQHNGVQKSYFSVNFTTASPYFQSNDPLPPLIYTVNNVQLLRLNNDGDVECKPDVYIEKVGAGTLEIINKTNSQKIIIDNLVNGEKIYMQGKTHVIASSQDEVAVYRAKDHNREWLELEVGDNELEIKGSCKIQFDTIYNYYTFF